MNLPAPSVGDGAGNSIPRASDFRRRLEEGENARSRSTSMRTTRIGKRRGWSTVWLAMAIAVSAAGCTTSDPGARKAALMKAAAAQQEKPVNLRYYGGPKYPRYPE